ncbi:hypothetical protein [Listeria booriae]|uniref:Uncharacterized protein n=1 Tax=Listeria booriae TaxID=1552123 RepID=A0A7X0TN60_9LIST|nr:hypothetical protein [Listeria booriae]MBC1210630.1 hypothetical protein [Listeria booriae]MBC1234115.1 hypothetical protein [Listeria booriae]MBC1247481.1 hypothetical protein [Listeria booriae]MBC1271466.1 hypothetical protein [Listeria booriae]MBC1286286.1 hypothetical protein [Listeria booriae]
MSQGGNLNPLVPLTGGGPVLGVAMLNGYPVAAAAIGIGIATVCAVILFRQKISKQQA